jgi:hypothetical protein
MNRARKKAALAFLLAAAFWLFATAWLFGCSSSTWRQKAPHNFPPAHEWNAGLETSWINAVDMWRRLTAPRGTIYDPVMRSNQPDFSEVLDQLDREGDRVSPPRAPRENASCGHLEGRIL